jgi:uncharacterized PurR-regulated membrane protein YhhQ (DUF165 family)
MLILMYLGAIVVANLLIAHYGAWVSSYVAFAFIGLDITALDHLHDAWHNKGLWWKMSGLIATGSFLSWLLNRDAGRIGIASFVAFLISAIVDRAVYAMAHKKGQYERIMISNFGSSLTDSILFPLLAFGWPPNPAIIFGQFTAKLAGGAFWALILGKRGKASS